MAGVEEEEHQPFLFQVLHPRHQQGRCILRALDHWPIAIVVRGDALSEFFWPAGDERP